MRLPFKTIVWSTHGPPKSLNDRWTCIANFVVNIVAAGDISFVGVVLTKVYIYTASAIVMLLSSNVRTNPFMKNKQSNMQAKEYSEALALLVVRWHKLQIGYK